MTIILILGAAAGAMLGFRHFKVWALVPLIVFAVSAVATNGIVTGLDRRNIILGLLAAVACPQIGYLVSFVRSLVTPQQPRPDRQSRFTMGSREQDLLLSNYKSHIHNRAACARHRLEGGAAVQAAAATYPVAPAVITTSDPVRG